jgi:hypothetical protein
VIFKSKKKKKEKNGFCVAPNRLRLKKYIFSWPLKLSNLFIWTIEKNTVTFLQPNLFGEILRGSSKI